MGGRLSCRTIGRQQPPSIAGMITRDWIENLISSERELASKSCNNNDMKDLLAREDMSRVAVDQRDIWI
jgi:hypothetical protein